MSAIKTIDVRELEHGEREALIFPSIEGLKGGETLRIIVEFNPLPLVYMLKARGEFEVSYEKEGSEEWILNVKRAALNEDRKEHFKELLKELKGGEVSEEAKERAKGLFQSVDAQTLGVIEQELIREGVSHDEIRKSLCDIHLEVLKDTLVSKRMEVSAPHPIHTFMEEHKIILANLDELDSLTEGLGERNSFEGMERDLEKLREIANNLMEAESHHQREEEVLFPALKRHDIIEPPEIMRLDHVEFRKRKRELYELSYNPEGSDFKSFKQRVVELGKYLTRELESHIFKEDNILYQIALQVLSQEEWEEVKARCNEIGYNIFAPRDLVRA
ncbi:MAG: DUF438 domain-containing protein [bacterium]